MAGMMNPGLTMDDVYPVGSIYMSVNSTDPGKLFGGTWQRIEERFLLAAGDTHTAGSTGGEFEHKLTVKEIPRHTHYQHTGNESGTKDSIYMPFAVSSHLMDWLEYIPTMETSPEGGDKPHNITPPYLAVYIWKRIA